MSAGRITLITILLGTAGIGAGMLAQRYLAPPKPAAATGSPLLPSPTQQLTALPDFTLQDMEGRPYKSNHWTGQLLVLNFWATWCPPCRKEIPDFMVLQEELGGKGLQFVGIAIDEPDKVRAFAADMRINYPILIGDVEEIAMSRQLGNRFQGLPFSVLFDRQGKVIHVQSGELPAQTIRDKISPYL